MSSGLSERAVDSEALASVGLFGDLAPDIIRQLTASLHRHTFRLNTTLMTVDQTGEAVYMILSGTVKVHVEQAGGADVLIAILGAGEIVGEMSLLADRRRSASVSALDETECLWMDGSTFRHAIRDIPGLALNLARILAARIRLANEQIQALAAPGVESRVARQRP